MSLRFATRVLRGLFVAFALACCQQQGEGAPCDTFNGNNDCQSNLVCTNKGNGVARCCPATGTSSSPDCAGNQSQTDANAVPNFDAMNTQESGVDASVQDGAPDAPASEASPSDGNAPDAGTD
jgi:hypothetical protein